MSMHLKNSRDMMVSEELGWWTSKTSLEQKLIVLTSVLFILSFCLMISTIVLSKKKPDCGKVTTVAPNPTDITKSTPGDVTPSSAPDVTPSSAPDVTPSPSPDVTPSPAPDVTSSPAPDVSPSSPTDSSTSETSPEEPEDKNKKEKSDGKTEQHEENDKENDENKTLQLSNSMSNEGKKRSFWVHYDVQKRK